MTINDNIKKFHQYRMSRYIQVEDLQGNTLLGFKNPESEKIFYYIPGMMMLFQFHDSCHCPNCIMVIDSMDDDTYITQHDKLRNMQRQREDTPRPCSHKLATYKSQPVQFG